MDDASVADENIHVADLPEGCPDSITVRHIAADSGCSRLFRHSSSGIMFFFV